MYRICHYTLWSVFTVLTLYCTLHCVHCLDILLYRRFHYTLCTVYTLLTLYCTGGFIINYALCAQYWYSVVQNYNLYTIVNTVCTILTLSCTEGFITHLTLYPVLAFYCTGGSTKNFKICTLNWHYCVQDVSLNTIHCVHCIATLLYRGFHNTLYTVYTVMTFNHTGGSTSQYTLYTLYWNYCTGGSTIHYDLCTLY